MDHSRVWRLVRELSLADGHEALDAADANGGEVWIVPLIQGHASHQRLERSRVVSAAGCARPGEGSRSQGRMEGQAAEGAELQAHRHGEL